VLVENLFDFARIDVGPAADNQLFLAIDNFQITWLKVCRANSPIIDPLNAPTESPNGLNWAPKMRRLAKVEPCP
jgi:hypothetical protein